MYDLCPAYPLKIPPDVGGGIGLGAWGDATFGVDGENLAVDAPHIAAAVLRTAAGRAFVRSEGAGPTLTRFIIALAPAAVLKVPLGTLVVRRPAAGHVG